MSAQEASLGSQQPQWGSSSRAGLGSSQKLAPVARPFTSLSRGGRTSSARGSPHLRALEVLPAAAAQLCLGSSPRAMLLAGHLPGSMGPRTQKAAALAASKPARFIRTPRRAVWQEPRLPTRQEGSSPEEILKREKLFPYGWKIDVLENTMISQRILWGLEKCSLLRFQPY